MTTQFHIWVDGLSGKTHFL